MAVVMVLVAAAAIATVLFRVLLAILTVSAGIAASLILYPLFGLTPYAGMVIAALITFAVGVSVRKLQYSTG